MPSHCVVPSCMATSLDKRTTRIFHTLPKDLNTCVKWIEAIGLEHCVDNLTKKRGSYRVCSDHFDDSSYEFKRILSKTALPTLQAVKHRTTQTKTEAKSEHTPETMGAAVRIKTEINEPVEIDEHTLRVEINRRAEEDSRTPVVAAPAGTATVTATTGRVGIGNQQQPAVSASAPSDSKEFLDYSRKFISAKTSNFIKCQMLMKKTAKRKLSLKDRLFFLGLYYHNPRAYGFLQQFMRLPPIRTFQNFYLNVNAGHISPNCRRLLELMVSKMNAKDRCCIVGIGSTVIKKHLYYDIKNDTIHGLHQVDEKKWRKPAKKAYALVVKGLLSKWQLPVAFALFYESDVHALVEWADKVTQTLMQKGLDVRAFVSNQGDADFTQLSKLRQISVDKNSFVLSNKTIYNIFDVRHLVRSLRDTLMSLDMSIDGESLASWDHIVTFYMTEIEQGTNLAAGITNAHVNPDDDQRKSTENARQLFSKSTAAVMKLFLRLKLLHESALPTVSLIDTVSDVFDLLNSDTIKHDSWSKRAYTGEEVQVKFLSEVTEYFQGIIGVKNGIPLCGEIEPVVGFIVTIKSIRDIWRDLSDDGCPHLLTRSLNSEFVEDCFRKIHSHAHGQKRKNKSDHITTIQFVRAFNKSFLNHMIKNSRLNSSKKLKLSLSKLNEYFGEKVEETNQKSAGEIDVILIGDLDHKISLPKQNVIRFIAGYLMTKALVKHFKCQKLKNYLDPSTNRGSMTYVNCEYLEKSSAYPQSLKLPVEFVLFVVKLEHEFIKVFQSELIPQEVGAKALNAMKPLVFLPCSCFPLFLVKKLFVRLRIYRALKFINGQFKTTDNFEVNIYDL